MLPEEKLAKRLLERHGLSPPVDVETLLRHYADLEFDHLPQGPDGVRLADAVCEKRRGIRPSVIVNRTYPNNRLRFTLAHELGHVVIPWHFGLLVEPVGFLSRDSDDNSAIDAGNDAEREANRFAAELLMPKQFTEALCCDLSPSDAVVELIRRAQVSVQAALIRTVPLLPRATILAISHPASGVQWCRRTPGAPSALLPNGAHVSDIEHFLDADEKGGSLLPDGRTLSFWRFGKAKPLPPMGEKQWRELENEILDSICETDHQSAKIRQSLAGVVGTVHSQMAAQGPEAIYGQLLLRCGLRAQVDEIYSRITKHAVFGEYIAARVRSLQPGYKAPRRKIKKRGVTAIQQV